MDIFEYSINLLAAMNTRPSKHGTRKDGKVCHAKPGECRYNPKYYKAGGLMNKDSWKLPIADENCNIRCCDLR